MNSTPSSFLPEWSTGYGIKAPLFVVAVSLVFCPIIKVLSSRGVSKTIALMITFGVIFFGFFGFDFFSWWANHSRDTEIAPCSSERLANTEAKMLKIKQMATDRDHEGETYMLNMVSRLENLIQKTRTIKLQK